MITLNNDLFNVLFIICIIIDESDISLNKKTIS